MTTTPRRAPKAAPPPSPSPEPETPWDLPSAFLAWQRQQPALADVSTLSGLLQLVRSLNDFNLTLRHALIETETATHIEAVVEHASGHVVGSGPLPLPLQASPLDFIQARILTTELVLGIARDATTQDFGELGVIPAGAVEFFPVTEPQPAPTPATPSPIAAPTPIAADPAEIDALRLQIETLPPDWQAYLTEAFRAEFGLPADRKVSPAIKSTAHLTFLRSLLPQQSAPNGQ
jgi:hypothetical protein